MFRSNHGCWTCRVRRKKCDESQPACITCTSRNITCHGYGNKPEWMDGGDRQKLELRHIKQEIQSNLRRKRRNTRRPHTADHPQSRENSDSPQNGSNDIMLPLFRQTEMFGSTLPSAAFETASTTNISEQLTSYREAELLMHYMDYVFPLQFRFHIPEVNGRGWLLWLLVKTRPLYHAALSLSALHQSIYFPDVFGNTYAELAEYHAKALRDLQQFLQNLQISGDRDDRGRQIEVMACGVSLISFELFQGGVSDWQLHLNALISILTSGNSSSVVNLLAETRHDLYAQNGPLNWQHTALSFLITVILWFDLLACASTERAPRMPYQSLLDQNAVDMSRYMGAQNWVMRAVGDIAALSVRKQVARANNSSIKHELMSQGRAIEQRLEMELGNLDSGHQTITPGASKQFDTVRNVTRAFATAALVQLRTILFEFSESPHTIQSAVTANISAMKSISNEQDMRGLVWPICISGSMAEPAQQPFYEDIVLKALGDAPRDFGNCATILKVLRRCWEFRLINPTSRASWRDAMAEIGICLLV